MSGRVPSDRLSSRDRSDSCQTYREASTVRFSEENTFYSLSSGSSESSQQDELTKDGIFSQENSGLGTDPWHVKDPALRRLSFLSRVGVHAQLPGGLRRRQHFVYPNGFRSQSLRLARLSPNDIFLRSDSTVIESQLPVLPNISSASTSPGHATKTATNQHKTKSKYGEQSSSSTASKPL